jgi:hypothetical protein
MIDPYEVPYPFVVKRDGSIMSLRSFTRRSTFGTNRWTLQKFEDEDGCVMVDFAYNRRHRQYIHRLVAEKFIPNPEGYEFVMFKDGNVKNCSADNLEWCP